MKHTLVFTKKKTPLVENLPVHPSIYPSVNQSINQPVIQYTYLSIIQLSTYVSINLSISHQYIYLSIYIYLCDLASAIKPFFGFSQNFVDKAYVSWESAQS